MVARIFSALDNMQRQAGQWRSCFSSILSRQQRQIKAILPMICSAIFGLVISFLIFNWSQAWEQERIITELERQAQSYVKSLRQSILSVSQTIEAIEKLYLLQGGIDRESFQTFLGREYTGLPSVEAYEWIAIVPAWQRGKMEAGIRNNGLFDFSIRETNSDGLLVRASPRPFYYPVIYTVPADRHGHMAGFDLATSSLLQQTMSEAIARGSITASPPIETISSEGAQYLVRFFLPITRHNSKKLQEVLGFASGVLFIDDLIDETLGTLEQSQTFQLNIFDGQNRTMAKKIYNSNWRKSSLREQEIIGSWETSIKLGQRTWHLQFNRLSSDYWFLQIPWLILAFSLCVTAVLSWYFWSTYLHTRRIEKLVDVRTCSLEEANASLRREIIERRNMEEKLYYGAYHDQLTGSLNRRAFQERLAYRFDDAMSLGDWSFAILFLDMDRFKLINDTHGHHAGDSVIKQVTKRINHVLRSIDVVARLGGDEFAILLEYTSDITSVEEVAQRLLEHMQQPFAVNGEEFETSGSIGIAMAHAAYTSPEDLLRDADIAMYQAKRQGRSRYALFDSSMHENASRELQLQTDLRRAMQRDELQVHYQPLFDLQTNTLAGFEALLRWRHPQQGYISPVTFIPIAEEIGIIDEIGAWVADRAIHDLHHWSAKRSAQDLFVNINISPRQLGKRKLASTIRAALERYRIAASRCHLEITETALAASPEETAAQLAALKELGVKLYIDDFGTGHASLNHLSLFPVDGLKIDRSFVDMLEHDSTKREIVHAIISMRKVLGLEITAEGIENAKQMAILADMQCDFGQGFHLSRPISSELVMDFIEQSLAGDMAPAMKPDVLLGNC